MALPKRSRFLLFLLGVFFMLAPSRLLASHAAGGELIYEWVSDSTYRFYFKFYRDCGGIEEPDTQRMCYFNSCDSSSFQVTLRKMIVLPEGRLNGEEVSPGCAGYYTSCSGGALEGFGEWWYSATVTLPRRCDFWTFYISLNGRNPSDNIPSSSTNGIPLYLEATLDNLNAQGSSSPYFTVKPVPYVCVGSPNTYNNGAVDPDNDSIAFELINPLTISLVHGTLCQNTNRATGLPFLGGLSLSEPLPSGGTFTFDPFSGQISFVPSLVSVNTLSMRVNKYRNGKIIGSVIRDVQMKVVTCSSVQPAFSVLPGTVSGADFTGGIIEGQTNRTISLCYKATSLPGVILSVSDNHSDVMPGSFVSYENMFTDSVTGCLSWTPGCADTGVRFFTVTVKDSTCLHPGILVAQTFVVPVRIRAGTIPTRKETVICPGGSVFLRPAAGNSPVTWSVLPGGDGTGSLSCTGCRNPEARPSRTTTYVGRYSPDRNGCVLEEQITVTVDTGRVLISPESPFVICRPDTVHLAADASGWPFRENSTCGYASVPPSAPQDSAEILVAGTPLQRVANNASTPFTGSFATARHQYLLRASDIRAAGITAGSLRSVGFHVSAFSAGSVFENLTISLGCTDLTTLTASSGFVPGTLPVYTSAGPVQVTAAGDFITFYFDDAYDWDSTRNLIVDICYANPGNVPPAHTYYFNTAYTSTLYAYAPSGSICQAPAAPVTGAPELPHIRLGYTPAPALPYDFVWENAVFHPSATVTTPSVYIDRTTSVYAYTTDRYGCRLGDTLEIIIPGPPGITPDTGVCAGDAFTLRVEDGVAWTWYENGFRTPVTLSCASCREPEASPEEDITYQVVVTDRFGCTDTLEVTVQVTPVPQVQVLNGDTLIPYGQRIRLEARGADHYSWSPGRYLDDPGIPAPFATPLESIVYTVTGSADANRQCATRDSVQISLDLRGRIFIPDAFTPNGDGRNDVFRIANLTFQQISEFRIFNRWGEEVFTGSNADPGWDGTWKSVPQPVGVYYYLVRLTYPDGVSEMFKGEFTLIR